MITEKILEKIVIRMNIKSQKKQIKHYLDIQKYVVPYKKLTEQEKEKVDKLLNNFLIFLPKIDKAKLIKSFFDVRLIPFEKHEILSVDLHFVWNDEIFPLSKKIDKMYRKIREEIFGRVADIESISIYPDLDIVFFPYDNASIGFYWMSIHLKSTESIYLPVIFVNTWNHMMSTRWTLDIAKRLGGYYKVKPEWTEGTREDAERYAKELLKKRESYEFKLGI